MSRTNQDDFKVLGPDARVDPYANYEAVSISDRTDYHGRQSRDIERNTVKTGVSGHATTGGFQKGYGEGSVKVSGEGPNAGASVGVNYAPGEYARASAMAEASLVRGSVQAGPAFVEGNLNANTGIQVGSDGARVNVLGFGAHVGASNRFSIDTPFGSFGFKSKPSSCCD